MGLETFNGFKKVCIVERNTNGSSGSIPNLKDVQSSTINKTVRSTYKVQRQDKDDSENDQETSVLAVREREPNPYPWNPSTELKFSCPITGHKQEVSKCKEFFDMSPEDRWEKLKKGRMCFSCLKPRGVCKLRKCVNHPKVSKALKCTQCASWRESKGLARIAFSFVNKRNMEC